MDSTGYFFGCDAYIFFIGTGVRELALVTMGMQTLTEWGRENGMKGPKTSYVLKRNNGLYYSYDVSKPQKAALEEIDKKLVQCKKCKFKKGSNSESYLAYEIAELNNIKDDILSDPKLGKPKLMSPEECRGSQRDYISDMSL